MLLAKILRQVVLAGDEDMTFRDFLTKAMSSMDYAPLRSTEELVYLHNEIRSNKDLENCKINEFIN